MSRTFRVLHGNSLNQLKTIEDETIQLVITSPPYFNLRKYSDDTLEIGVENSPNDYINNLVDVGRELIRILKPEGAFYLNIDDKFASRDYSEISVKKGSLMMIPERLSISLQSIGFILREKIIWYKSNPLSESSKNRRHRCWEYFFCFAKNLDKYYYNADNISDHLPIKQEKQLTLMDKRKLLKDGKLMVGNKSGEIDVMPEFIRRGIDPFERCFRCGSYNYRHVAIQSGQPRLILCSNKRVPKNIIYSAVGKSHDNHFASFPPAIVIPPILSNSRENDIVLDPFCGTGTTGVEALKLGRNFIGIDINKEYVDLSYKNLSSIKNNKNLVLF